MLQVSKAWLEAVDAEVLHLSGGKHLPSNLTARFPALRTLDLRGCNPRCHPPAEELAQTILELPTLEALHNLHLTVLQSIMGSTTPGGVEQVRAFTARASIIFPLYHSNRNSPGAQANNAHVKGNPLPAVTPIIQEARLT